MKYIQSINACAAITLLLSACVLPVVRTEPTPISPKEIVAMSKAGQSTSSIIGKIQDSGTVYSLTASQLVQLAKEGVPDRVLDHMQRTHIMAVERTARRGYATGGPFIYVPAL